MKVWRLVGLAALGTVAVGCTRSGVERGDVSYQMPDVGLRPPPAWRVLKVSTLPDQSRVIEVQVDHLRPADREAAWPVVYVVWLKPCGAVAPAKVGRLTVDRRGHASFVTTTSLASFDLFVTAETDPTVAQPRGRPVLSTRWPRYLASEIGRSFFTREGSAKRRAPLSLL
jgi:hypothetical protein